MRLWPTSDSPRTVLGFTVKEVVLHIVAAGVSGGTIFVLTGDTYAGVAATLIGAVWFFLGIIYGYGEATGI